MLRVLAGSGSTALLGKMRLHLSEKLQSVLRHYIRHDSKTRVESYDRCINCEDCVSPAMIKSILPRLNTIVP